MAATSEMARDSVHAIWRYPVKSMMGEEISIAEVTPRGLAGDRAYALVDKASNRAAVVRTWAARLLNYRAEFVGEPNPDLPVPIVRITCPDGVVLTGSLSDIDGRLSAAFDRALSLMSIAPAGLLVELPAGTLGGKLTNVTEVLLAGAAPPGTFFDYACVHLIATSTIDHLQSAYPKGQFDVRRFRPNLVIRTQGEPFIENSWAGRMLAIGNHVVLRASIPCPRCVNTTLPQGDLSHDTGILRTIAQHNMRDLGDFGKLPCAGVYADVVQSGSVRCGDTVRCLD
jgi:hypothetical protein